MTCAPSRLPLQGAVCLVRALTIHSSRTRFVAPRQNRMTRAGRLNSGVRPLKALPVLVPRNVAVLSLRFSRRVPYSIARALHFLSSALAVPHPARLAHPAVSHGRPVIHVARPGTFPSLARQACRRRGVVGKWRPNKSFKPNPLRGFALNDPQFHSARVTGFVRSGSA